MKNDRNEIDSVDARSASNDTLSLECGSQLWQYALRKGRRMVLEGSIPKHYAVRRMLGNVSRTTHSNAKKTPTFASDLFDTCQLFGGRRMSCGKFSESFKNGSTERMRSTQRSSAIRDKRLRDSKSNLNFQVPSRTQLLS
jgi:hypothetical protein